MQQGCSSTALCREAAAALNGPSLAGVCGTADTAAGADLHVHEAFGAMGPACSSRGRPEGSCGSEAKGMRRAARDDSAEGRARSKTEDAKQTEQQGWEDDSECQGFEESCTPSEPQSSGASFLSCTSAGDSTLEQLSLCAAAAAADEGCLEPMEDAASEAGTDDSSRSLAQLTALDAAALMQQLCTERQARDAGMASVRGSYHPPSSCSDCVGEESTLLPHLYSRNHQASALCDWASLLGGPASSTGVVMQPGQQTLAGQLQQQYQHRQQAPDVLSYSSPLTGLRRVVRVKVSGIEPEDLTPGGAAAMSGLHGGLASAFPGHVLMGACVRPGCVEFTLEFMETDGEGEGEEARVGPGHRASVTVSRGSHSSTGSGTGSGSSLGPASGSASSSSLGTGSPSVRKDLRQLLREVPASEWLQWLGMQDGGAGGATVDVQVGLGRRMHVALPLKAPLLACLSC